jgi:hypothetical protein
MNIRSRFAGPLGVVASARGWGIDRNQELDRQDLYISDDACQRQPRIYFH